MDPVLRELAENLYWQWSGNPKPDRLELFDWIDETSPVELTTRELDAVTDFILGKLKAEE